MKFTIKLHLFKFLTEFFLCAMEAIFVTTQAQRGKGTKGGEKKLCASVPFFMLLHPDTSQRLNFRESGGDYNYSISR